MSKQPRKSPLAPRRCSAPPPVTSNLHHSLPVMAAALVFDRDWLSARGKRSLASRSRPRALADYLDSKRTVVHGPAVRQRTRTDSVVFVLGESPSLARWSAAAMRRPKRTAKEWMKARDRQAAMASRYVVGHSLVVGKHPHRKDGRRTCAKCRRRAKRGRRPHTWK